MSLPRFEVATGPIDGVNTSFHVSLGYRAGTLAVFLNGQLKVENFTQDGWLETDPATGLFDMRLAPMDGDVLQAFYLDTLPAQVGEEVTPLCGRIVSVADLHGQFSEIGRIQGRLEMQP